MFYSDFEPVWEQGATPSTTGDFEENVTFEATGEAPNSNTETNGPLTARVETSNWTTDDVMMALQAANVVMFLILLYLTFGDRGGA